MDRAAERRKLKNIKKKVKNLSVTELQRIIDNTAGEAFEKGHEEGFNLGIKVAISALKREFGFGDKRIDRLMNSMERKVM